MDFDFKWVEDKIVINPCKGLFFRGYNETFMHNQNIIMKQGLNFLKRMSCSGCEKCGWIWEVMNDQLDSKCVIIPEIERGALYSVRIVNESKDWETGYVDSFDFQFFKVKE